MKIGVHATGKKKGLQNSEGVEIRKIPRRFGGG